MVAELKAAATTLLVMMLTPLAHALVLQRSEPEAEELAGAAAVSSQWAGAAEEPEGVGAFETQPAQIQAKLAAKKGKEKVIAKIHAMVDAQNGLQLTTAPDWATALAGGTLTTHTDICVEGSPYHYTKDLNCKHNDIEAYDVPIVGASGWLDAFKQCAAECDARPNCLSIAYGWAYCWIKHTVGNIPSAGLTCAGSDSDAGWTWLTKTGAGTCTAATAASATGDPHLQNIYGERFDLMKPGNVTLVHIPRGVPVMDSLLIVEADARRLGESCADLYFQTLSITGKWAISDLHFKAHGSPDTKATWLQFGPVELKVAHGRTEKGQEYLNFFVKHLGRVGTAVGGLLGADDHAEAATPSAECRKTVSLAKHAKRSAPELQDASVAIAAL